MHKTNKVPEVIGLSGTVLLRVRGGKTALWLNAVRIGEHAASCQSPAAGESYDGKN
jgi:hypothetical protein